MSSLVESYMLADIGFMQESSFVLNIIRGIGVIGFICCLLSISRIRREGGVITDKDNRILGVFRSKVHGDMTLGDFIQTGLAPQLYEGNGGDGKLKNRNHFTVRLDAMIAPLRENLNSNKVCELPRLHDLHELTLQEELSRFSSSSMRTIVSILLICGIFGTLHGVHNCLGEESGFERDLNRLAPALEPSMWAVGFTVFLMVLRGIYTKMVDAYLSNLDSLTITLLTPRLQPPSNLSENLRTLGEKIRDFSSGMGGFLNSSQSIDDATQAFHASSESLNKVSESLKQTIDSVQESVKLVLAASSKHNSTLSGTQQQVAELKQVCAPLAVICKDVTATLGTFKDNVANSNTQYQDMQSKLKEALNALRKGSEHLEDADREASIVQNYISDIKTYQGKLQSFVKEQQELGSHMSSLEALEKQVQSIVDNAGQTVGQTHNVAQKFGNSAQSAADSLGAIRAQVETKNTEVQKHFDSMSNKLGELEGRTREFISAVDRMTKNTKRLR